MLNGEDRQQDLAARDARRRQVTTRLGRVDLALLQWEEWQDARDWPPELRRDVPTPARAYDNLKLLRARVVAQLARERARHGSPLSPAE